jgi:magnesium and cobalt transporter
VGVDLLPDDLDEEVDTVGGLLFTKLGRVPVKGEVVKHDSGIEFEILDADPRRIKKVRVLLPKEMREERAAGAE